MSAPARPRLLICDDEPAARRAASRTLGEEGFELVECADGQECLDALALTPADLVLLDLRMPVLDGRAALARILALPDPPPVVVVTADASLRSAIEAVRAGAADYVVKPYDVEELRLAVAKALETARLRRDHRRLADEVRRLAGDGALRGESAAMAAVLDAVERVAPTAASVLITGETGTGKELVARRIHQQSEVRAGPFVAVNCAAIPEALVESELFGHRRGAFTGADRDRAGRFQEADLGTLFLDEVGDMPLAAQAKLLRVLEDGVIEPVGGGRRIAVRVRTIAATHHDLRQLAAAGRFRDDLLFRLRVVELELPPLRARGDDVVLLARGFLAGLGRRPLGLDPAAEAALRAYRWPGNVRELRNAIERAAIFCRGAAVGPPDLPAEVRAAVALAPAGAAAAPAWQPGTDLQAAKRALVERFEREAVSAALRASGGNVSAAARALGMHRQNLQAKLRELGLDAEGFKAGAASTGGEPS